MSRNLLRNPISLAIMALLVLILIGSTLTIVPETSQAVILRFEQPVRTINAYQKGERFGNTGAGLIMRVPFIDRIVWVDKRILDVELDNQPVLSSDQLPLEVDAYARFRVVDPLKMVVTARSEEGVTAALQPLLANSIRNELGNQPSATLLTPERERVMENIQARLQRLASQYGVAIVDVRIKHADLPEGSPMQSALDRMKSARKQQATTIRAQGYRDAQIIRADAEAKAAAIYAASFNKDPEFYDFYRAMQSYRTTFSGTAQQPGSTSIILSPENSYLRQFVGRK
ncbi:MAG: rane protease subunit HflC [Sphingomonas bacterium]|jgi:membrane protease subunit HflC|uniref:protease modulator HflC n=1 Tax=Sphingomonas bacterium TaxID=1895847 RepID=UPI002629E614|nr:protease modulator HflC [Sphingomonas bacterium]MDB5709355.1 rane protease subunit HflC [Sphingomonas bacterium]